ncbi:MAG: heparinase II/III-family protein [Carboxylicivirga sp.]|jgi:hypothetical protein|nr:heparinase II/III-family protein [Carboxylicivirga sp.]
MSSYKRIIWFTLFLTNVLVGFSQSNTPLNLLCNSSDKESLSKILLNDKSWISYPNYKNREAWEAIPANLRKKYIAEAEAYLNFQWPTIPATAYLDFVRTGSRQVMEKPFSQKIKALETLVKGELLEGKGRFLDDIINGVFAFCEQTYWGNSAHLTIQKKGAGLPDVNDPTIDLSTGRVATNLAWTWHFFKEEFDSVNPLIAERIEYEIRKKVLDPFYSRDDFWWMAFKTNFVNNWNPWCNYNVLNCILLMENDADKKLAGVYKTMQSVDQFINYYKADGACEEGPAYWSHAGGKLFDYLELLNQASDNKLTIYEHPLIRNIGEYICKAYIGGQYFTNFADASPRPHTRPGVIYRYGKRVNSDLMMAFGAYLFDEYQMGTEPIAGKIEQTLNNLFSSSEINAANKQVPLLSEFYLPDTEIGGARDKSGSEKGFYFAFKGGYNRESHNHNDAGSFLLYYNAQPVLVDAGVGTYTRKTFSSQRYEIWTMQSAYHNLPQINGVDQAFGYAYKAEQVHFTNSRKQVKSSLEIANAYPKEAKVKSWKRQYVLQRNKKFIINDEYQLEKFMAHSKLHFLTPFNCDIRQPGLVVLSNESLQMAMKYDASKFEVKVEQINIEDAKLVRVWGQELKRLVFTIKGQHLSDQLKIEITNIK